MVCYQQKTIMRIAIVQTDPKFGEPASNVRDALALMESERADIYVLPELCTSGYNFIDEKEVQVLSEPPVGQTHQRFVEFARKRSCYVVYGFAERSDGIYNSASLVGKEGLIGLYRKVHLYAREKLFFVPGNLGFPVFELPFGTIGMMVCFDWIFPESARTLMMNGAQLIAHPSNLVMPYCPDAMVTRCLENRVFAATANRIGREDRGGIDLSYIGKSEIVSPRGEILTRSGENEAGVRVVEIDIRTAASKSINDFNNLADDRRPSQYFPQ